MDDKELSSIVQAEIRSAAGYIGSDLSGERANAFDYYMGRPFGNEREGYSSVVSTDVRDTVEWMLPSLMRIFCAGDDAVEFEPTGPEDEELAEQATDFVNHIWHKDNAGFLIFHHWFKDALIQKNGHVKIYWDEVKEAPRKSMDGLAQEAYELLIAEEGVEVVEHTANEDGTHDIVYTKAETKGRVTVENIPPEELLVDAQAVDIQSCRFVAHVARKTRSQLIEEGFDRELVEGLSTEEGSDRYDDEHRTRDTVGDEERYSRINNSNKAMEEVTVHECYIRADYDDDGIAEMRKVTVAGTGYEVLENDAWEGPRPFASLTPVPMPHRFWGLSIADLIMDLQLIKSTILRQYLDALYLQNNPTSEVDMDAIENPSSVLDKKPGGVILKHGPNQAVLPVITNDISGSALQGLEYVDQIRENRTGVSRNTQGLTHDTLHDTASGAAMIYDAAQMRIELIARIFAETGVKEAFKLILWLTKRYQQEERVIRLRGKWTPMSPDQWSADYDVSPNVGLGYGTRDQQAMQISQIIAYQTQAIQAQGGIQGPLVGLNELHNGLAEFTKLAGFKNADKFFMDPDSPEVQQLLQQQAAQSQPDAMMVAAQAEMQKAQADMAKVENEKQKFGLEVQKAQAANQVEAAKLETERLKLQLEQAKAMSGAEAEKAKIIGEAQSKLTQAQMALKDAETKQAQTQAMIIKAAADTQLIRAKTEGQLLDNQRTEQMIRAGVDPEMVNGLKALGDDQPVTE